ncbi:MAG TPA: alpha/beta fold hydrolase [Dokdonella sp.]
MDRVILLHGLWMRGFALRWLARRVRRAGYAVETFDYASVTRGFAPAVDALRARIRAAGEPVHLVGHSLGALVALEAARATSARADRRVVCLGPPFRGSAVARVLAARPAARWMLGRSADALVAGVDAWAGAHRVGVIAGSLPLGFGAALAALEAPHDGTVAVAETRLPGIADHRVVASSHTGLLLSSTVADLTVDFLRDGRFARDGSASAC